MGCGTSKLEGLEKKSTKPSGESSDSHGLSNDPNCLDFRHYSADEIFKATSQFNDTSVLSKEISLSNVVFKGNIGGSWFAIKKFKVEEWPDPEHFKKEAEKLGSIRIDGLNPLVGFSLEEGLRVLITPLVQNGTLPDHLFHFSASGRPMTMAQRLHVATMTSKTLNLLANKGFKVYHDLSPYRILLGKDLEPQLSAFGLIRAPSEDYSSNLSNLPPEHMETGNFETTSESTIYGFGCILLGLLSGKRIPPNQFLQLASQRSNWDLILDSALVNSPECQLALQLIPLAANCLKRDPLERPSISEITKELVILEQKFKNSEKKREVRKSTLPPPPIAQAVENNDFEKIHLILVNEGYSTLPKESRDEPSFEFWDEEKLRMMSGRKEGDKAFRAKKWGEAIAHYNEYQKLGIELPCLFFARRSFSYLMNGDPDSSLRSALQSRAVDPEWYMAYFLVAAALKGHNQMEHVAQEIAKGIEKYQAMSTTDFSET